MKNSTKVLAALISLFSSTYSVRALEYYPTGLGDNMRTGVGERMRKYFQQTESINPQAEPDQNQLSQEWQQRTDKPHILPPLPRLPRGRR